jgi:hypothetical protein
MTGDVRHKELPHVGDSRHEEALGGIAGDADGQQTRVLAAQPPLTYPGCGHLLDERPL